SGFVLRLLQMLLAVRLRRRLAEFAALGHHQLALDEIAFTDKLGADVDELSGCRWCRLARSLRHGYLLGDWLGPVTVWESAVTGPRIMRAMESLFELYLRRFP